MAQQSLYRRYRPQRFSEIRGQHHVRQALQTAVREGRWSHAYLFSGPRGTGKTTTARVLAKALNCEDLGADGEPCGRCESCVAVEQGRSFDLHELDAASHNKVDDIRDLISKVHLGSPGRTKVYILDEVHMLTQGAENALLKTLEEPPDHVVFVLATTEPHKVVPTIRSRTQHFEFQLLPGDELAEHVRWVITDAGLEVGDEAVDYVLRAGGGSARDTLSALDLVSAAGGVPAGSAVGVELVRAIGEGDTPAAIEAVQRALETGREPRTIAEEALAHLRDAFLASMGAGLSHLSDGQADQARESAGAMGPATLTRALESLGAAVVEMRQSPDPRIPLEVCLLRLTRRTGTDPAALLQRIEALEAEVAALRASAVAPAAAPPAATPPPPATAPAGDDGPEPGAVEADPGERTAGGAAPAPADPSTGVGGRRAERRAEAEAPTAPPEPDGAPEAGDAPAPPPPSRRGGGRPADAARRTLQDRDSVRRPERPAASGRTRPAPPPPPPGGAPGAASPRPRPTGRRRSAEEGTGASTGSPAPAAPHPDTASGDVGGPGAPAAAAAGGPTLEAIQAAWVGGVLDALSNRARARYKVGRFLALDGATARFALPNPIHRDRCAELQSEVEAALAATLGHAVALRLEVDTTPEPGRDHFTPGPSPRADGPDDGPDDDIGDISELADANDVARSGIERLTRAFPGSEVITHDD